MRPVNWSSPINWNHGLNRGLMSWWLVVPHWAGGTTWRDLARLRDGTLVNMEPASDWAVTADGPVLSLGGTDEYITAGTNIPTLASPWTLAGYIHLNAVPADGFTSPLAGFYVGSAEWVSISFTQSGANTRLKIATNGETPGTGSIVISAGVTYHIAVTHDGTDLFGYVDGVLDYSVTPGASDWQTSTAIIMGALHPTVAAAHFTNGQMWDNRMYDRCVSAPELAELAQLGKQGHPGLLNRARRVFKAPAVAAGIAVLRRRIEAA